MVECATLFRPTLRLSDPDKRAVAYPALSRIAGRIAGEGAERSEAGEGGSQAAS